VRFAALVSLSQPTVYHLIRDPAETGKRLQFNPKDRLSLLFVAEKSLGAQIGEVQQSDYSVRWSESDEKGSTKTSDKPFSPASLIPGPIRRRLSDWRIRRRRQRDNTRGMIRCTSMTEAWAQTPHA
jgi:hypothetical protein